MMAQDPQITKIGAGLMCAMLWTTAKGLNEGDIVLAPTNADMFHVGVVTGPYEYVPEGALPHRRPVEWQTQLISRAQMSQDLWRSTATPATINNIRRHTTELEQLLRGGSGPLTPVDPTIEDATAFALEKHREEFLVANWATTDLGKSNRIFEQDGESSVPSWLIARMSIGPVSAWLNAASTRPTTAHSTPRLRERGSKSGLPGGCNHR